MLPVIVNKNSISSPYDFFDLMVTPNFNDFYNNQDDIRLAFHAVMALDHLVDWIANSLGQKRGSFIQEKYQQFPEIKTIRNLSANAKHFPPTNAPIMHVTTAKESLAIDNFPLIDDWPDLDTYGAGCPVIANEENGDKLWLVNPITSVYAFWKREYDEKKWG